MEHVDSQFLARKLSHTKASFPKRKIALIDNSSRSLVSTPTIHPDPDLPYISQMSKIMRPCIKNIVNVKGMVIVDTGL